MTTRPNRSDPWHGPGSAFEPNTGPADDSDQFAPLDIRGAGLRQFVEQNLQAQSATSNSGSRALIPGKIFLKELRDGTYELLIYKGRCTYDAYPGQTAEELLEFARTLVKEPTW